MSHHSDLSNGKRCELRISNYKYSDISCWSNNKSESFGRNHVYKVASARYCGTMSQCFIQCNIFSFEWKNEDFCCQQTMKGENNGVY